MNKAQVIGNVGKDPDIRSLNSGGKVANFSVATSERWRDKNSGERHERTEWHRIAVFNETLIDKVIVPYVKKGTKLYVEGQLQTRKWQDQGGQDRYTTEIVLKAYRGEIELLGGKDDAGDPHAAANRQADDNYQRSSAQSEPRQQSLGAELDDEIPF